MGYIKPLAIGMIAGMRTLAAPALVSSYRGQNGTVLGSPRLSQALKLLALSELVADTLPIPPRTATGPLLARITSGAISAAALATADDQDAEVGALLGGLAAVAGAFGFYHLRRKAKAVTAIPDPVLGVAEDLLLFGVGWAILGGGKRVLRT